MALLTHRVLIVDPGQDDCLLAEELLGRCVGTRCETSRAAGIADGLAILRGSPFDICLVELRLGAESGLAFIREARAAGFQLPMILMTGAGGDQLDRAAQSAGAAHYLDKRELTSEQLERAIRYCVAHRPPEDGGTAAGRAALEAGASEPALHSGDCPRILLVEDDEDDYLLARELLHEIFGGRLRLDWARSWTSALSAIAEARHDVCLIDYRLGERNGLELVREAIERGSSAPFIVLTGQGSREIDLEAMRAGAMDYLVKGEITAPLLDRSIRYSIERYRAERRLTDLARLDQLTGLANRLQMHDFLSRSLARADRYGHAVALILIDLDRFKPVNDTYGHGAGDRLLQVIAERLRTNVRASDLVARLGGDEFTVTVTDVQDPAALAPTIQRLLAIVRQPIDLGPCEVEVGASIGVALYPSDAGSLESLLLSADIAMYAAKEERAGGICFYTGEMRERTARRLALERDLRRALARDELCLHYQPQIELRSGRIVGLEALIRWRHPELGLVPPAEFIALAEESDLINTIGDWVIRTACAQLGRWRRNGRPDVRMAINLSARQLRDPKLAKTIAGLLEAHEVPAHLLEIEITETQILQRPTEVQKLLGHFLESGIRVALDDFGTGYSSLNHLRSFRGASIKIDRSFIHSICDDPNDAAIVKSLIAMAHDLGLKVVAEGVETMEQLIFLNRCECDYVQGFLLSEPRPAEDLTDELLTAPLFEPFHALRPKSKVKRRAG